MTHHDTLQPPEPDGATTLSRRRFLQGGLAAAAAASIALPLSGSEAATAQPNLRDAPPKPIRGKGPNILIILCDQMRFPPSYESDLTRQFREAHLGFQNELLANGLNFQRHYIMSAACVAVARVHADRTLPVAPRDQPDLRRGEGSLRPRRILARPEQRADVQS